MKKEDLKSNNISRFWYHNMLMLYDYIKPKHISPGYWGGADNSCPETGGRWGQDQNCAEDAAGVPGNKATVYTAVK